MALLVGLLLGLAACLPPAPPNRNHQSTGRTIRVVMDNNYPPYTYLDSQGHPQGILIDQWRMWEQKTGIRVDLHTMDWDEAQKRMERGEFDVIDTIFFNESRAKKYDFSAPYVSIPVPIFFRNNISGLADAGSLRGFTVGVKAGDNAIDVLKANGVENLIEYNSYEAIIQAARDGKIVVFVIDEPPGLYFLYKYGLESQFNYSAPLYSGEFHRAVLHGNSELLTEVETGFAQISPSEYAAIEHKWLGLTSMSNSLALRLITFGVAGVLFVGSILLLWNRALQRRVQQRTAELTAVFDSMTDMAIVYDRSGRYLEIPSQKANHIYYDHHEVIGKNVSEVLPPQQSKLILDNIQTALERHEPIHFEYSLPIQNREMWFSGVISPMAKDRALLVARDISDRRQAEFQIQQANEQLIAAYDATLKGWSSALDMREHETGDHSQRVVNQTLELARVLGIPEEEMPAIRRGALLHDIGKMAIPDSILLKPAGLTPDEWVIMRQHPIYAYHFLSGIPYLQSALVIPYAHHERWDGSGYPDGLQGEKIPLAARIFAVVDVWDALTSNRPYRPAWTSRAALAYLEEQSGRLFDPRVVAAFIALNPTIHPSHPPE
jgi:PAS domain S-box-containing protein/putative nucleotidyltransferase with HDIG domain